MYASELPRESTSSEICVEINRNVKNIPNIIDRNLKKDQQILIIFETQCIYTDQQAMSFV